MKTVKIHFHNAEYDYLTSVSEKATEAEIEAYFVGQWFNMGHDETDNMQQCIDVSIIIK